MLLLPWCVIQRNDRRGLRTRDLWDHHCNRRDPMPARSADDVYLCLWRWHRQFGAGTSHVGANQRKNGKCAASVAIRSSIYVSSRHHPAPLRSALQDGPVSSFLHAQQTIPARAPHGLSRLRVDHPTDRAGHVDRYESWVSEENFGDQGYPRCSSFIRREIVVRPASPARQQRSLGPVIGQSETGSLLHCSEN